MTKHRHLKTLLLAGIVLTFAGVILAQSETASTPAHAPAKTLIVNGKSAGAVAREIDGHTYIEIEALARSMNGSVTIDPDRVLLTIPVTITNPAVSTGGAVSNSTVAAKPVKRDISPDFRRTAIAELSDIREWRGAVGAMVTYGLAASDISAGEYHDRCEDGLNEASVAVETESDGHALELLKREFENMNTWANQILAERKKLNGARTVTANSLQNDHALQSITACGRFLSAMIVSGDFNDDGSCH